MPPTASYLLSAVDQSGIPTDGKPHIAMIGRSNVGKSSMINHLAQQKKLARVSAEPGRTQTINLYDFNGDFYLVDLPGYGYAKSSKAQREGFATMITDYLEHTDMLRLAMLIIDARIPLSTLDADMIVWLQEHNTPFIIVLNKMDKVKASASAAVHATFESLAPGIQRVEHSILSGKNQKELWAVINRTLRST